MDDLIRRAVTRRRGQGGALPGTAEPAPPPGPEPPPDPEPPKVGKIPAGPRGDWWAAPAGGDFIAQLLRRSRRYP
jgi:hypothetical protein